jgi:hypothetical protein
MEDDPDIAALRKANRRPLWIALGLIGGWLLLGGASVVRGRSVVRPEHEVLGEHLRTQLRRCRFRVHGVPPSSRPRRG